MLVLWAVAAPAKTVCEQFSPEAARAALGAGAARVGDVQNPLLCAYALPNAPGATPKALATLTATLMPAGQPEVARQILDKTRKDMRGQDVAGVGDAAVFYRTSRCGTLAATRGGQVYGLELCDAKNTLTDAILPKLQDALKSILAAGS
jgi:hypothetical protein